ISVAGDRCGADGVRPALVDSRGCGCRRGMADSDGRARLIRCAWRAGPNSSYRRRSVGMNRSATTCGIAAIAALCVCGADLYLSAVALAQADGPRVSAQTPAAPTNNQPHPYQNVECYFKLPEGRTWGSTSAVDIDKDGKSIWIAERCGVNSCLDRAT